MAVRPALLLGDDFVVNDWFCVDLINDFKNHWRQSDPCANLTNIQPGMIVSDSDDEKLYHRQAAACQEILQSNTPFGDDNQIIGGDGSDSILIPYEETTNDAIIWGLPIDPKRGLIFCDVADIGANFTGLITATGFPEINLVDLDIDSRIRLGFTADDKPTILLQSGAYYSLIQESQAEGLAGADLRIGLDPALRIAILCERGDINDDFGLAAEPDPTLVIFDAAGTAYAKFGVHIVLPQVNDAVTPTLAFGDGDTGFYEVVANELGISTIGVARFRISAGFIRADIAGGPALKRVDSTAIEPGLVPDFGDTDTGIGHATADQLSLIAGGVEAIRIKEDTTIDVAVFGNLTRKFTVTIDDTDGNVTHLIAAMLGGHIRRGTGDQLTAARTDITDTAANIVAAIPGCIVGSGFEFSIANEDSTHTVALGGGAGVTIIPNDPSTAIPTNSTAIFLVVVTNIGGGTEAINVYALGASVH